jgi:hypothetical protein
MNHKVVALFICSARHWASQNMQREESSNDGRA